VVAVTVSETIASSPANPVYEALNCLGLETPVATGVQYICLIFYEMGMLVLNCIAFWRMARQNPPGRLIMTLYRDGVMYMAAMLVFSVINAVVTLVRSSDVLNSPQMVLHSILASRVFFNLRETTRREQESSLSITLSEFRVATQGSSGFNSSLATSSGVAVDPKAVDNTRVTDIT